MSNPESLPTSPELDQALATETDPERRAALAKLATLAAWTAPTLLTLMVPAQAQEGFGSAPGNPGTYPG